MSFIDEGLIIALSKSIEKVGQFSELPDIGSDRRLYQTTDNNNLYSWNGSGYDLVSSVGGGLTFLGTYNAQTNTPAISSGSGAEGDYYIVEVGATGLSIDGITELNIGDQVLSQAKVPSGTEWVRIPNINTTIPPVFISTSQTLTGIDTTYVVTANTDLELVIPLSDASNEGRFIRIVKEAGAGNINVVPTAPEVFLGGKSFFEITGVAEGITLFSSGNSGDSWIKIQDSRNDVPKANLELLGDNNSEKLENENWLIEVNGDFLQGFRRQADTWVLVFSFGESITTDKFILADNSGSITFIDIGGNSNTIIKPSIDTTGVVLGNPDGRVALIYNEELFAVDYDNSTVITTNVQTDTSETENSNDFQYEAITTFVQALLNFDLSLANVPAGTTSRFSLEDENGVLLSQSVSEFDFINGDGQLITNGINNFVFEEPFPIEDGFKFTGRLQTTNNVDIQGLTTDLGDGLGTRFFPYLVARSYGGVIYNVTNDGNIVAQIEEKTGADRVDISAIKNTELDLVDVSQAQDASITFTRRNTTEVTVNPRPWEYDSNTNANTVNLTNASAGTDIVELSTYDFEINGEYEIRVIGTFRTTSTFREMFGRIQLDGNIVDEKDFAVVRSNDDFEYQQHYFYTAPMTATREIKFNARKESSSSTVSMTNTRIDVKRLS